MTELDLVQRPPDVRVEVVHREMDGTRDERWTALYEECRTPIYRSVALMVGAAEAEEVVQEAFEIAMREHDFFEQVRDPIAWLRTVAARRALSRLRRRRLFDHLPLRARQADGLEAWERADIAVALARLPARERVAVVLRYYADATYDDIGSALGIGSASIGPLLTRARVRLREALC